MNIFFFNLAIQEKTGGLFDFDGTFFIIAIQTIILTLVLNSILFNPLINSIEERTMYVNNNLIKASETIKEAELMLATYEVSLALFRGRTEKEILEFKTLFNEIFDFEIRFNQYLLDNVTVRNYVENLDTEKYQIVDTLLIDLKSFANLIYQKLGLKSI